MELLRNLEAAVATQARALVSGDRYRYFDAELGVDLDLSYITERIVAMGYPSSPNSAEDVARLLNARHPGHYWVFNLSERNFDATLFHQQHSHMGWNDHHPPPLAHLVTVVEAVQAYLAADPQNVAVIHCLAGKSRTGTVVASLLHTQGFDVDAAIDLFNARRGPTPSLQLPSQVRCFAAMLERGAGLAGAGTLLGAPPTLWLETLVLHPVPSAGLSRSGWLPRVTVGDARALKGSAPPLLDMEGVHTPHTQPAVAVPLGVAVTGDVFVTVYHVTHLLVRTATPLFRFWLHTSMIDAAHFDLTHADADACGADTPLGGDLAGLRVRLMFRPSASS